jgi:hypothetical protein
MSTRRVTQHSPSKSLAAHYERLQSQLPIVEDAVFGPLVVPNGNAAAPVHRWFHLKESFSADLLSSLLSRLGMRNKTDLSLIDPYAGVATSLVSALGAATAKGKEHQFSRVLGIERNPFLHLVASTKVRSLTTPNSGLESFREAVLERYRSEGVKPAPRPRLSTFSNPNYFPPAVLRELLRLKAAIDETEGDDLSRDVARVCLAGCIEPLSNLRRDGRALRYEKRKTLTKPVDEFNRRFDVAIADLASATTPVRARARVALGDGREPSNYVRKDGRFNLALFSPPYANNIDYTEVYKLENWFLDLIGSEVEFRAQRLRTVRSHPSVAFEESYPLSENGYKKAVAATLTPLLVAIPADRYRHQRRRLVNGYFEDMLQTFKGLYDLLDRGGRAVYVVGNSAHGHGATSFLVASDVIMASLAELVGFTVQELIVARFPSRRNIPSANVPAGLLRESVVILRK